MKPWKYVLMPEILLDDSHVSAGKTGKHRIILTIIVLVIMAGTCWLTFRWATEWRFLIKTDDAYIQGDIAAIAPKVNGYIESVPVQANQAVRKNDILFRLDDGDYKIALLEAEAKLVTQKQTLDRIKSQIDASRTNLDEAEAEKAAATAVEVNANLTLNRATQLKKKQFAPQSGVDSAQSAHDQARANVTRAQAKIDLARANITVLEAQYSETESQTRILQLARDKAQRDFDFTVLRAPFDGVIGNLSAKLGDFVSAGQRLAALVPVQELYIDANYKETQLPYIYGGETAHISVDGLDNLIFEGKVLSLAPATGSVFSILPPQNATGNFTKIVQRIPVRISIPADILASGRIRAGMSVVVSVDTRTKPADINAFSPGQK